MRARPLRTPINRPAQLSSAQLSSAQFSSVRLSPTPDHWTWPRYKITKSIWIKRESERASEWMNTIRPIGQNFIFELQIADCNHMEEKKILTPSFLPSYNMAWDVCKAKRGEARWDEMGAEPGRDWSLKSGRTARSFLRAIQCVWVYLPAASWHLAVELFGNNV